MKKLFFFLVFPFLSFSQNFYDLQHNNHYDNPQVVGCIDLDETIIDLVSLFGDTSLLDGLLGCSELIPTLESGILSAFLPFDIPLDCGTDLTPFGYLDMDVSDICECSCHKYLDIHKYHLTTRKIINKLDILGSETGNKGFQFEVYDDGSVEKKYLIK